MARARTGRVEQAAKKVLKAMAVPGGEVLAETALLLARRLDAAPPDREATMLSRELRMVVGELRGLAGAGSGELDAFLAGIAAEEFGR